MNTPLGSPQTKSEHFLADAVALPGPTEHGTEAALPKQAVSSGKPAASAGKKAKLGTVVLLGNPNVGKTTLYNALTGQNERVGNYAGVTVERRSGSARTKAGFSFDLVDVPGAYSLSARSMEEQTALDSALGLNGNPTPALGVVLVDAGQLSRNLYLVLQLIEFQLPLILALTMMDEANPVPDPLRVGKLFGVPCVSVNPKTRQGLDALSELIASTLPAPRRGDVNVQYGIETQRDIDSVADRLPAVYRRNVERDRALAAWALLSVEPHDELALPEEIRKACIEVRHNAEAQGRDLDLAIISARYEHIERMLPSVYPENAVVEPRIDWTDRVDRVLLHPVYGFAIFLGFMLLIFQSLFSWADPAISLIEQAVSALSALGSQHLPEGFLSALLIQGVLGGVGNVVVFLPQIVLLFLFVSLLEDSGYMARVAYLMDRVLRGVGLHGKAFVPMLSGMACAVPAIMATRTMERRRDRLLTMMVVPLMSCSARLPVYALVIGAMFPPSQVFGWLPVQGLLLVAMYLFSTLTTLLAAWVLGRTIIRGPRVPLILELPRYRWPSLASTVRSVWLRARDFLTEAGTVILGFTILLWLLLSYPKPPTDVSVSPTAAIPGAAINTAAIPGAAINTAAIPGAAINTAAIPGAAINTAAIPGAAINTAAAAAASNVPSLSPLNAAPAEKHPSAIEYSLGGRLSKGLSPLMAPLGFDWKLTVGILGAFSAREVFVSTLGLVFGLDGDDDNVEPLRQSMRAETRPDGKPAYPPLVGLSLLIFFALACQCTSTLAVVKRETRSWRWPAILFAYMTTLAYVASLIVYQGGRFLGFPG